MTNSVQTVTSKKEFVQYLFQKGIVLEKTLLDRINKSEFEEIVQYIERNDLSLFGKAEYEILQQKEKNYFTDNNIFLNVSVKKEYVEKNAKKTVRDFVSYYHHRYKFMKRILQTREGIGTIASINKMFHMKDVDEISIIGLVQKIWITKNGHKMLELEDITGRVRILLNKNKQDIVGAAKDLVEDEIIAVKGRLGDNIMFANKIFFPDIPMSKEFKKGPDEVYAAFISDVHVGSQRFLENVLEQFIRWINCKTGSDKQKHVAERLGYLFIVGDVIAGVGNYPGQEENLDIVDVKDQFDKTASYLKKIPSHLKIIICPGNHDPVRLAEPQPKFPKKYAASLYEMDNVTISTNPCVVTIHETESFPGFDVLMYHGFSYFYYGDKVESLIEAGGNDKTSEIMKYLLKKRHLAPAHNSNLYIPDKEEDFLIINETPDFFVSGHVHKTYVDQYRQITLLVGSCWQSKSPYEEKLGREPEIGRVPIVNLQTREVKVYRFDHDGN